MHIEEEVEPAAERGRSGDDSPDLPEDDLDLQREEADAFVRSFFPETWLFKDLTLPSSGEQTLSEALPGSMTTWVVSAIAVGPSTPMCVSRPHELRAFKPLFVDLHMPYAAVRHEQIEIRATVFNYGDHDHDVQAVMTGVSGLCSGALPGQNSTAKQFLVPAHDSATVSFLIVPLKVGEFPVKVTVVAQDGAVDIVQKILRVAPEGVEKVALYSAVLDPSGQLKQRTKRSTGESNVLAYELLDDTSSKQTNTIDLTVPEDAIPDTDRCSVTVMGDLLGATVQTVLGGMGPIVDIPTGCGEQTMIHMAPAAYSMYYLQRTGQLTDEMEKNGQKYLIDGYNQELSFRTDDGSFSVWPHLDSSTWLTAFVLKVFCQAEEFIYIDKKVTCVAMSWIIQQQKASGAFDENYKIWHKEMMGGLNGEAPLTAFVVISMLTCNNCEIPDLMSSVARAVGFLEHELPYLTKPYAVTIVTYALSLAHSTKTPIAVEKLKALAHHNTTANIRYWPVDSSSVNENSVNWYQHNSTAVEIESTAYALLAMLREEELSYGNPIVEWLIQQRNAHGGFLSTQDTVVALQALADYSARAKVDELELICEITSETNQTFLKHVTVHKNNALVQQQHTVPTGGELQINTTGRGVGQLQVELHYHVPSVDTQFCTYDLTVQAKEHKDYTRDGGRNRKFSSAYARIQTKPNGRSATGSRSRFPREATRSRFDYDVPVATRSGSVYILEIETCVRYLKDTPAGMTILDIGIFTGFEPIINDLELLVNEASEYVQHFEQSSRGIIVYLEQVPSAAPYCLKFRARREFNVGTIQAAPVKVFNYYEPDDLCTVFYRPEAGSPLLEMICVGSECVCAEGNCGKCWGYGRRDVAPLPYGDLWEKVCNENVYAFRITVTKVERQNSLEKITAVVRTVIKQGKDSFDTRNKRIFLKYTSCFCPNVEKGSEYFVSGKEIFKFKTKAGKISYKYFLDHNTYMERWYKKRELRHAGPEAKLSYTKLRKLENKIRKRQCRRK